MLLLLSLFSTSQPLLALHHAKLPEESEKSDSSSSFELEAEDERDLEKLGLTLSNAHARVWREQFGRKGKGRVRRDVKDSPDKGKDDTKQGEDREDIKRGKGYRKGKAYWGLDKIFGQATKTKDHFSKEIAGLGGLVNRVGDLFGASDDYDEDEVIFSLIKNATNLFLSKSYRKGEKSGHCGFYSLKF